MKDLKDIQLEYHQKPLEREHLSPTPYQQVLKWFQDVEKEEISYPNAAIISTVDTNGIPSSRTILVKEIREEGFVIYTDFSSKKGQDLRKNPHASLIFFWKELDRQIRIQGRISRLSYKESEKYFHSRPRGSQISAFASMQSSPITKKELQAKVDQVDSEYEIIPCPERWGGCILSIEKAEFWQGRPNRLHDRFQYTKKETHWIIERLSP